MKNIYYKGIKKAQYDSNTLNFINKEDETLFKELFDKNAGIYQEEDEEGNVAFIEKPLSVNEKILILQDLGFSLNK